MNRQAPEGYAALVEVHLPDGSRVVPHDVHGGIPSWVMLETRDDVDDPATHRVILIQPKDIAGIEIRYARKDKTQLGFRFEAPSDPTG